MHVVVTGAAGFVGAGLVRRLLAAPLALGGPITRLSLVDRGFSGPPGAPWVHQHAGDLADAAWLWSVLPTPVDLVFHLASVPGALAERDPALGARVNLHGALALAEGIVTRRPSAVSPPRLVFASTVAVYGALGPGAVEETAAPQPALSYGAHKLMLEIALADLSRRGELDARSLRLPGIVARPPAHSGHGSAFMSQVFHRLAAGEAFDCPVSAQATGWWMSLRCCVDNLLHAARLPAAGLPASRVFQLPVLHLGIAEVVQALARRHGDHCAGLMRWYPEERIEALFGRLPALHTPQALAAGFRADPDADALVAAVLADLLPH